MTTQSERISILRSLYSKTAPVAPKVTTPAVDATPTVDATSTVVTTPVADAKSVADATPTADATPVADAKPAPPRAPPRAPPLPPSLMAAAGAKSAPPPMLSAKVPAPPSRPVARATPVVPPTVGTKSVAGATPVVDTTPAVYTNVLPLAPANRPVATPGGGANAPTPPTGGTTAVASTNVLPPPPPSRPVAMPGGAKAPAPANQQAATAAAPKGGATPVASAKASAPPTDNAKVVPHPSPSDISLEPSDDEDEKEYSAILRKYDATRKQLRDLRLLIKSALPEGTIMNRVVALVNLALESEAVRKSEKEQRATLHASLAAANQELEQLRAQVAGVEHVRADVTAASTLVCQIEGNLQSARAELVAQQMEYAASVAGLEARAKEAEGRVKVAEERAKAVEERAKVAEERAKEAEERARVATNTCEEWNQQFQTGALVWKDSSSVVQLDVEQLKAQGREEAIALREEAIALREEELRQQCIIMQTRAVELDRHARELSSQQEGFEKQRAACVAIATHFYEHLAPATSVLVDLIQATGVVQDETHYTCESGDTQAAGNTQAAGDTP